jgi:hypothetical protein
MFSGSYICVTAFIMRSVMLQATWRISDPVIQSLIFHYEFISVSSLSFKALEAIMKISHL